MVVSGAVVSTVKVREAGVASVVAGGVGGADLEGVGAVGEGGGRERARSRLAKRPGVDCGTGSVEPVSVEVKVKSGVESLVSSAVRTVPVMVVSGAVVSTVNERLAGVGSMFPAASIARTWKVCGPWPAPPS